MLYLRAAQDINLSSGPSRTQYQYALRSIDSTSWRSGRNASPSA